MTRIAGITEGGKPFHPLIAGDVIVDEDGDRHEFRRYSSTGWFGHFRDVRTGQDIKLPLAGLRIVEPDSRQRAWETAMGMRGYAGSPAHLDDIRERRR